MGFFSSRNDQLIAEYQAKIAAYERRISELSDEIQSLETRLAGERAVNENIIEEQSEQIARMMDADRDWSKLPRILYDAIDLYKTATPTGYIYFQDTLAKIPPFRLIDFKLRKQTSKNVPNGWAVEKGGVVMLYEGEMVGKFPPEKVEELGLSTSRVNRGFVIPPCVDVDEGFSINERYVPQLFI